MAASFFLEPQPVISADDLQDAVIRQIQGLERIANTLNLNSADPFLKEFSEIAEVRQANVQALDQRLAAAPRL